MALLSMVIPSRFWRMPKDLRIAYLGCIYGAGIAILAGAVVIACKSVGLSLFLALPISLVFLLFGLNYVLYIVEGSFTKGLT